MSITQRLFDLVGGHRIQGVGFSWIKHVKVVKVDLVKHFFGITRPIESGHKVYFDLYNKGDYAQEFVGYANIEKDWIDLGYKKRNKIKEMIQKQFKSEYVVGNYRNNFDK